MARRPALKVSRGSDRPSSRGGRPSKSAAVRVRGGSRSGNAPRPVVVHVAMKRALRKGALRDCGQRCVYCATHLDQRTATLDHVVPLARGGAHDPGNLVVACGPCNRLKSDLLPYEFFARHPWAGANFIRYARNVTRAIKRGARRAVSLAFARDGEALAA
ncbi:HNH endonuclease [Gemmatimonas phototrophica]|uniref:HNH endonuclease n=1 Tax=Gemmatimonas phototrophica TaxID=1379270 RepID=UPI0005BE79A2|nr:HNH endonuclease [Gemmatimonas phototrophica]